MNILIIGPLSRDKIIKEGEVYESTGGAVYYQSRVLSALGIENTVVLTLSYEDRGLLKDFSPRTHLHPIYTPKTISFENIYPDPNPNFRIQKGEIPKNPIKKSHLQSLGNDFNAIIISPLSAHDIPLETIEYLDKWDIPLYLSVQGFLRHLEDDKIVIRPWRDVHTYLPYFNMVFMDEVEARTIYLQSSDNKPQNIAQLGPSEVIITQGDNGALIYSKIQDKIIKINPIPPRKIVDPTGLGDTFMAAYIARKLEKFGPRECGIFASAAASLKLEHKGAFNADKNSILNRIKRIY